MKISATMKSGLESLSDGKPDIYRSWGDRTMKALKNRGLVERCSVQNPNVGMSAHKLAAWRITDAGRKALASS